MCVCVRASVDTTGMRRKIRILAVQMYGDCFNSVCVCVCSDEPVEAYRTLRQVVKDYLGVEEQGGEDQRTTDTPTGRCLCALQHIYVRSSVSLTCQHL